MNRCVSARHGQVGVGCLADHAGCVATVAGWLHAEWFRDLGLSAQTALDTVRARLNRDRLPLALVAVAGRKAVGTVSLTAADDACRLVGLYVHPDWRRQGIGRRLCEHATGLAWASGRTRVVLETTDAADYYARLGWTPIADTVVENGPVLALAVVMQRVASTEPPSVDVMRRST